MGAIISSGANSMSITNSGLIILNGSASVWDDLRVEPSVRASAGAGVPAFEKYVSSGTSNGVYLYSFTDESVANNEKELFFTMQMPHGWKGTDIHLHNHWIPSVSSGGQVVWGLEYTWSSIGSVFPTTTTITTVDAFPSGVSLVANKHYLSEFAPIPSTGSTNGLSTVLIGRMFRNSSTGSDTYAHKVGLLYIDAHYEIDQMGSQDELKK